MNEYGELNPRELRHISISKEPMKPWAPHIEFFMPGHVITLVDDWRAFIIDEIVDSDSGIVIRAHEQGAEEQLVLELRDNLDKRVILVGYVGEKSED